MKKIRNNFSNNKELLKKLEVIKENYNNLNKCKTRITYLKNINEAKKIINHTNTHYEEEKINEWENHLKELKVNNEELMETYIFNTLKLNQMNQLLTDNENKISIKEKIVKEKRLVNDRLEQLRFVLEYQIKKKN